MNKTPKTKSMKTTAALGLLLASMAFVPNASAECGSTEAPLVDRVNECVTLAEDTGQLAIATSVGTAQDTLVLVNGIAQHKLAYAGGEANSTIENAQTTVDNAIQGVQDGANGAIEDGQEGLGTAVSAALAQAEWARLTASDAVSDGGDAASTVVQVGAEEARNGVELVFSLPERTEAFVICKVFTGPEPCEL